MLVIGFFANIVGAISLSEFLTHSVIESVTISLFLYALVLTLYSIITTAIYSDYVKQSAILSQNQMLRLAAAMAGGFGEVIETALQESMARTLDAQWQGLEGVLAELGRDPDGDDREGRRGYPRRVARITDNLPLRRERTRAGWCLHVTGPDARTGVVTDILDEVERLFTPG